MLFRSIDFTLTFSSFLSSVLDLEVVGSGCASRFERDIMHVHSNPDLCYILVEEKASIFQRANILQHLFTAKHYLKYFLYLFLVKTIYSCH